jgi:2-polyprenyl-6-methoxyphenol hydroxylase-like FAD-dependent oxidoreductase
MKIVIVGAGIAGLSSYLFLKKHLASLPGIELEIQIYDGHDVSGYINKSVTPTLDGGTPALLDSNGQSSSDTVFTPEAIGSAIGIARNGLDSLARLYSKGNDDFTFSWGILSDMLREGHSANRWQMHGARGWLLADLSMLPKSVEKQEAARASAKWKDSPINLIMISRQAFWALLLREVVNRYGMNVVQHKKVTDVAMPIDDDAKATIQFADGTSEAADLVIGADGLRSTLRKVIYSSPLMNQQCSEPKYPEPGRSSRLTSYLSSSRKVPDNKGVDYIQPHYSGLVGVSAFVPSNLLTSTNYPQSTMSVCLGSNGFFGYGYITSAPSKDTDSHKDSDTIHSLGTSSNPGPISVFWSTFPSPDDPAPFALSKSTARSKPYEFNKDVAVKSIINRHKSWKNPTIEAIVSYLEDCIDSTASTTADPSKSSHKPPNESTAKTSLFNSLGFYPTMTTPSLPTYSLTTPSSSIVLIGDAAHALTPSSGQGASQALEDAEVLALLLRHHYLKSSQSSTTSLGSSSLPPTTSSMNAIHQALSSYNTLRLPRLQYIQSESTKLRPPATTMSPLQEWMMYIMIFLMMKMTKFTKVRGYQEIVQDYDLLADVRRVVGDDLL